MSFKIYGIPNLVLYKKEIDSSLKHLSDYLSTVNLTIHDICPIIFQAHGSDKSITNNAGQSAMDAAVAGVYMYPNDSIIILRYCVICPNIFIAMMIDLYIRVLIMIHPGIYDDNRWVSRGDWASRNGRAVW